MENSTEDNNIQPTQPAVKPKEHNNILILFIIATIILLALTIFSLVIINANKKPSGSTTAANDAELVQNEPAPTKNQQDIATSTSDANHYIAANEQNGYIADHIRGNANAKVIVIEYSDFQCPGCASLAPYLPQLYTKYQNDVLFISRNYPLTMHQNAKPAAMAAESASLQGYYWQMSEALFEHRSEWASLSGENLTNSFVNLFQSVAPEGDVEAFEAHLDDQNLAKKIDFDHDIAKSAHQLSSTPSFYINGERADIFGGTIQDAISTLEKTIDAKLAE